MTGTRISAAGHRLHAMVGQSLLPGAAAGSAGGILFGMAWLELGMLPSIASLARTDSEVVGLVVHMVVAAIVGAGLGLLVSARWSLVDSLFWGIAYGAFFWFLGPLTLVPIILGSVPAWDVAAAQAGFPSLLGHIVWGAAAGLALVLIRAWRTPDRKERATGPRSSDAPGQVSRGVIARGVMAGLAGFILISLVPMGRERMLFVLGDPGVAEGAFIGPVLVALAWAVLFALAHPASAPTAGAAVVRGSGFGFILWVVAGLTLLPILRGDGLDWSIAEARAAFPAFLGSVLYGAATALAYHWLTRLTPVLFSDDDPVTPPDGGSWGPRAMLRGAAAGLLGGIVFTVVMVQIGFLPIVASLVGSASEFVGLIVHLLIAATIGATFGLLFRRQAFDAAAAIGWGVSYGFVWWVLGPLTLAPIILGAAPPWSVEAAASAFPGLVGHLAYGAVLGLSFYMLEARYTPWWVSRTEREAVRMAGRRRVAISAGPALWALLVVVAVLLPTVLAATSPPGGDPADSAEVYSPSRPTPP